MMKLIFFAALFLLYFVHDFVMSWLFRKRYQKADDFVGEKASNETQRFFGKATWLVMAYYGLALVSMATEFDFGGLISEVRVLSAGPIQVTGFILGVISLAMMTWSRLDLGISWRVGLDDQATDGLVTQGLYRHSRNPYFAFLLTFLFSLILISPSAITLLAFIQSLLLLNLQVRQEELFLTEKYGEPYLKYKGATGRFWPKF
jgi:protein-S-isoprenylcysteine O-methyltransferase Ste14